MKKQEIISVLYELHKITGFRMSLHDVEFNEIAAYPENLLPFCSFIHEIKGEHKTCVECDQNAFTTVLRTKKPLIYKCRYGLTEAISPLYNFGILTGFLMMGQIGDEKTDVSKIKDIFSSLGIKNAASCALIENMPRVSSDMIKSYVRIMTICAQYLTLSNAMPGIKPSSAELAKKYIYENLDKKITIKDLCDEAGCSKSTLISSFKKEFGITVNTAITEARLEKAKKLLSTADTSINEVAQLTGFYDQSYFSKVFSSKFGITPSEYKRSMDSKYLRQ